MSEHAANEWNSNWMSLIPQRKLIDLSILGTRGSATNLCYGGPLFQSSTVVQQLENGIRFLDFSIGTDQTSNCERPLMFNSKFGLCTGENDVTTTIESVITFLKAHETETVLIQLRDLKLFDCTAKLERLLQQYSDYIFSKADKDLANMKLNETKGKIIFVTNDDSVLSSTKIPSFNEATSTSYGNNTVSLKDLVNSLLSQAETDSVEELSTFGYHTFADIHSLVTWDKTATVTNAAFRENFKRIRNTRDLNYGTANVINVDFYQQHQGQIVNEVLDHGICNGKPVGKNIPGGSCKTLDLPPFPKMFQSDYYTIESHAQFCPVSHPYVCQIRQRFKEKCDDCDNAAVTAIEMACCDSKSDKKMIHLGGIMEDSWGIWGEYSEMLQPSMTGISVHSGKEYTDDLTGINGISVFHGNKEVEVPGEFSTTETEENRYICPGSHPFICGFRHNWGALHEDDVIGSLELRPFCCEIDAFTSEGHTGGILAGVAAGVVAIGASVLAFRKIKNRTRTNSEDVLNAVKE